MSVDPFESKALRQNLRQRTVRGGVVTLGAQGMLFVIQFVGSVLMARMLKPEDFGLVGMVVAVVGFLDTFKDLGLSAATVQEPEITRSQVNVLFWYNALAGFAATVLTICIAPVLVRFYGRPELLYITIALAAGFAVSGLAAQQKALLRRSMNFGRIAKIDISTSVIALGAGLTAAYFESGYWSVVVQQLARAVVSAGGLWLSTDWRPGRFRWDPSVRPMLRFGGFFALNNIMNYATRNVDNVAIGWKWGAEPLGLYSRAYSLLMLPLSQVNTPLAQVAIPALSRLRGERDRFRERFLTLMRTAGFFLTPLVATLMACSDSLVILLLGQKWAEVGNIYRWLGFAALAQPMTTTCGVLFQSQGRSREMSQSTLVNSCLAIAAIILAVPWGVTAVAASYSVTGLFIRTPVLLYFSGRDGFVTQRDMYSVVLPQLLFGAMIFATSVAAVHLSGSVDHRVRVLIAVSMALMLFSVGLLVSKRQRESFIEITTLLRIRRKAAVNKD